ncbi:hypothetical protein NIES2119_09920 [[Phormidium ambiguum] IAM M-71]|uniref:Uncharacterized protein n=1 Tax=[Phormidium ambiguum] IAM M-71 TaxID=454136 RepID=A0A1U7IMD2_9CYAN|nr:hypothetical protein NIES2119_09920 [Phormidium ambiguum IAM M-71]
METPFYDSMNFVTKRRFTRIRMAFGKEKPYRPHGTLVQNLCKAFGWDATRVVEQLHKERNYLLKQIGKKR